MKRIPSKEKEGKGNGSVSGWGSWTGRSRSLSHPPVSKTQALKKLVSR
jgi:hypothetical protein